MSGFFIFQTMHKTKKDSRIKDLLASENKHIKLLHELLAKAIEEEQLLTQKLYREDSESLTFGERLSDKVAEFGGSWRFIISFMAVLFAWILVNTFILVDKPFDPYPFILLNLVLSCVAALQAPVIMMSQNRKEEKDRKRAENDYLINLKAEIEIRNLHEKIDLLMMDQMKNLFEIQKIQTELLERISDSNKK